MFHHHMNHHSFLFFVRHSIQASRTVSLVLAATCTGWQQYDATAWTVPTRINEYVGLRVNIIELNEARYTPWSTAGIVCCSEWKRGRGQHPLGLVLGWTAPTLSTGPRMSWPVGEGLTLCWDSLEIVSWNTLSNLVRECLVEMWVVDTCPISSSLWRKQFSFERLFLWIQDSSQQWVRQKPYQGLLFRGSDGGHRMAKCWRCAGEVLYVARYSRHVATAVNCEESSGWLGIIRTKIEVCRFYCSK